MLSKIGLGLGQGQPATPEEMAAEIDALSRFYKMTGGPLWAKNTNWLSDKPISTWYGVELNKQGFVLKLKLIDNNLVGKLTDSLGTLKYLEKIKLNGNKNLQGPIPEDLTKLSCLAYFQVDTKAFQLPDDWNTLPWKPEAQRDFIKENAVAHVVKRNYNNLNRMQVMLASHVRSWQTGDMETFYANTHKDLVISIQHTLSGNSLLEGQDNVWSYRKTLRPKLRPYSMSAIDVRVDNVLSCFVTTYNPFTGETTDVLNYNCKFDEKCRLISKISSIAVYTCSGEEEGELLKMLDVEDEKKRKTAEGAAETLKKVEEAKQKAGGEKLSADAVTTKSMKTEEPVELQGVLMKKGRGFPYNWKTRCFHLVSGSLSYYDDGDNRCMKGGISSLKGFAVQSYSVKDFEFVLRAGGNSAKDATDLHVRAQSQTDYDKWVLACKLHIAYCDSR